MSGYGWLALLVSVAAAGLTGVIRRYALRVGLLDLPGARRSHARATPRGGGVAIAAVSLSTAIWLAAAGAIAGADAWALCGAGLAVTMIGFVDDHRPLAPRWRLLVHLLAAVWALYWSGQAASAHRWFAGRGDAASGGTPPGDMLAGGMLPRWIAELFTAWLPPGTVERFLSPASMPGAPVQVLLALAVLAFVLLALVWLINLYNFMDGIDAMAALQTVVVCLAGALLYVLTGRPSLAILPLVLAAACAGFLCWNLPPARIFLGDAGSGFLGASVAILALQAGRADPALLAAWIILLAVFIVDASVTLSTRALRRQPLWQAHREHAYQHLARRCARHLPVSAGYALVTALWSTPLAIAVALHRLDAPAGLLIACTPLIGAAWFLRAGVQESCQYN